MGTRGISPAAIGQPSLAMAADKFSPVAVQEDIAPADVEECSIPVGDQEETVPWLFQKLPRWLLV